MFNLAKDFLGRNAKAVAAYVASVVVAVSLDVFGVKVPADVEIAVSALVVSLVVWFTRNR